MVNHRAQGIGAARARAGVRALHIDASLIARALGVYGALGSAIGRLTRVILEAGAGGRAADVPALGETAARGRHARVPLYRARWNHS